MALEGGITRKKEWWEQTHQEKKLKQDLRHEQERSPYIPTRLARAPSGKGWIKVSGRHLKKEGASIRNLKEVINSEEIVGLEDLGSETDVDMYGPA